MKGTCVRSGMSLALVFSIMLLTGQASALTFEKGVDANPLISGGAPRSLFELATRISTNAGSTENEGLLKTSNTAGASVLIIPGNEPTDQSIFNNLPSGWDAVDLDGDGHFDSIAQGFGMADISADKVATPSTIYNIGSLSKTVTAWMVKNAADWGWFEVDAKNKVDPSSVAPNGLFKKVVPSGAFSYLSSWHLSQALSKLLSKTTAQNYSSWINNITIRTLLSHRSGLARDDIPFIGTVTENYSEVLPLAAFLATGYLGGSAVSFSDDFVEAPNTWLGYRWKWAGFPFMTDNTAYCKILGKDLLSTFCPHPKIYYQYSNSGYAVLQMIFEDAMKRSVEEAKIQGNFIPDLSSWNSGGWKDPVKVTEGQNARDNYYNIYPQYKLFPVFARDYVFTTFGMSDTSFLFERKPALAQGYDSINWNNFREDGFVAATQNKAVTRLWSAPADGGIYTTVVDFGKFIWRMLEKDSYSRPRIDRILELEPIVRYCTTNNKELGYGVVDEEAAKYFGYAPATQYKTFLEHGGKTLGWQSGFMAAPERKAAIIVFTNTASLLSSNGGAKVVDRIIDAWKSYYIEDWDARYP